MFTRRKFLAASLKSGGAIATATSVPGQQTPAKGTPMPAREVTTHLPLAVTINGTAQTLAIDVRTSLLDLLRERLQLTGSKKGCNHGACGACTVLVDGRRVLACLTLAVMCDGKAVTTIEGIGSVDALHPLQAAFIEHEGFQCGYCTSGQIMSGIGCIAEWHAGSIGAIREFMSGNICRCGAYPGIVAAIQHVAGKA
jgi:xanthine dehydrogenase YagT iron-sulfur-binding subunit